MRNDSAADQHVESARIQEQIESHLGLGGAQLLFEYRTVDSQVQLDLITVNPRHRQSFLFHTETGYSKLEALQKMLHYVQHVREKESSYTIQWQAREDRELQTSYFRAHHIYEALDKLYYGRDFNTITVFSVVLNPIA